MKKLMLMAAAAGMLLAPVASQAVLVTNVYTNYIGTYTYATNKYEQPVTVQGTACFVVEGKTSKTQESNERLQRCSFTTRDILSAAGIPNGNGKLVRRQNRYTQTLTYSNTIVNTTLYDVTNGVCYNYITNTLKTNVVSGTKCWVYASTENFDSEENIFAISADGQTVKLLNASSNSAVSSVVEFWFHDHGTLAADSFARNGVGSYTEKALIHYGISTSGGSSNKLWNVSNSSFEADGDQYPIASYTVRTVYNAQAKCLETAPGSGSWTGSDWFYHYYPNPCGPGTTYNEGLHTTTVRLGAAVKKP